MKNRIKTNKTNKDNKINKIQIEVGLDEVGRGSLFGPLLVASFLIIKINNFNPYNTLKLKDSKKLTENQRITIFNEIINILRKYKNISKLNFYFISNELIDKINILNANLLGFEKLIIINLENILKNKEIIDNLDKIEYINFYLDGDKKPYNIESKIQEFLKTNFNYLKIDELLKKINILNYVKGDSNIRVIQLAAISAKVTRDKYIQFLAQKFPQYNLYYNLYNNKGYYEEIHIKGIRDYGITKYHRKSFLKKYFQKTLF
jgi:ribonuclease HII